MNLFEAVKESVTACQAAQKYGIRVGRNGMACCPFHDDRHPSMKVDERFYCFGCGASGDVIDFVSRMEGVGAKEAALRLSEEYRIPYGEIILPERGLAKESRKRRNSGFGGWRKSVSASSPTTIISSYGGRNRKPRKRRRKNGANTLRRP